MFTADIGENQGFFHPHHHQCRDPKCDLWQRQCDVWQCVTRPAPSDWSYVHNVGSPAQCNTTHCSRQHRNETPHQIQLGLVPGLLLWPPTSLLMLLWKNWDIQIIEIGKQVETTEWRITNPSFKFGFFEILHPKHDFERRFGHGTHKSSVTICRQLHIWTPPASAMPPSTVVINNGVITQRIETSALTLHNGDNSHRVLPLQINQSKYLLYSPRCDCRQYSPLLHGDRGSYICQYCTSTSLLCNDDNDINDKRQVWCWEMRCLN